MSTPSSVENSSPTTKVDTEVLSEERLTSESSDATLSGGSISSVPSQSSELNDASATTAAVVSTSARGDIDCSGNDGDKISSVEKKKKKKSVSISEGDSSNDKATTTDSDMEDCQDASGSSSEVSGVAGRVGANPSVADSSTSTDVSLGGSTSSISSLSSEYASASAASASATSQKGSVVVDSVTQGTVDSLDGSTSGVARSVDNSAASEHDESIMVRYRVCHLILSPTSTQI